MRVKDNPTLIRDDKTEAILGDSQSYEIFMKKVKAKKKKEDLLGQICLEIKKINQRLIVLEQRLKEF